MKIIKNKMTKLLSLDWLETDTGDSQFGYCSMQLQQFRDENKNLIITGDWQVFIACMYKEDKEKRFYYMTFYKKAKVRQYRHKYFHNQEHKKIFASGKTQMEMFNDFVDKFQLADTGFNVEYCLKEVA